MVLFSLLCLFCKDHWLVGWMLGALFCVCTVFFFVFFSTRLKDSGNVNISHYKDCPPRESTHNEVFFSHCPCPPVCLSHFRIFFSPSFFLWHIVVGFSRPFIWPVKKLAKNHLSNQARWTQIRRAHWKNLSLVCYGLEENQQILI